MNLILENTDSVRYFTNMIPSMDTGNAENWGFVDYIRWAMAHNSRKR